MEWALTMREIIRELQQHYQICFYNRETIPIEETLYFENLSVAPAREAVYICRFSQIEYEMPEALPANLVVVCESPDAASATCPQSSCNVAVITASRGTMPLTIQAVHDCIAGLMHAHRVNTRWKHEIMGELLANQSMQRIVNTASDYFGNPMLVQDNSFKLLTHSQKFEVDEWIWEQITDLKATPYEVIRHIRTNDFAKVYATDEPVFIPKDNLVPNDTLACRIDVMGKAVGHVSVIGYFRPINDAMAHSLYFLSRVLSQYFQKRDLNQLTRGVIYESFLVDLLEGRAFDRHSVEHRLKTLALAPVENICLMTLKSVAKADHQIPSLFMRDLLKRELPAAKSVIYKNDIVMLLSGASGEVLLSHDKKVAISRLLRENELTAGISRCFTDITALSVHYEQTLSALEIGAAIHGVSKTLFFYDEYAPYHAIDLATHAAGDNLVFCAPELLRLLDREEQSGFETLETLYVYLSLGCNLASSAAALKLHRNTVDYRIRRIREQIGVCFSDPEKLFHLLFSYRILIRNGLFTPPSL